MLQGSLVMSASQPLLAQRAHWRLQWPCQAMPAPPNHLHKRKARLPFQLDLWLRGVLAVPLREEVPRPALFGGAQRLLPRRERPARAAGQQRPVLEERHRNLSGQEGAE